MKILAYYYLKKLKFEWDRYVHRHEWRKRYVDQQSAGLLDRAAYRLFEPKLDNAMVDSVSRCITEIQNDWSFLDMFYRSIEEWSDADKLIQNEGRDSLTSKVGVLSDEIQKVIRDCGCGKKFFTTPKKLLSLLADCRRKTDELLFRAEFGEALEKMSNFAFEANCGYDCNWFGFLESIRRNLLSIEDAFDTDDGDLNKQVDVLYVELGLIRKYLLGWQNESMKFKRFKRHAFSAHLAFGVVKIALQSFDIWISRDDSEMAKVKATKLVDLKHQIDPANPEFMKLFLNLQVALRDAKSEEKPVFYPSDCVVSFCKYLLASCYEGSASVMTSLVNIYLRDTLQNKSSREDVSCLFAEVYAVLGKVAILHHSVPQGKDTDHLSACSELFAEVGFLNLELLIKEQLQIISSSMHSFDRKIMQGLVQLVKDLCQQKTTGRYLILAEELNSYIQLPGKREFFSKNNTKFWLRNLLFKIISFKAEKFLVELLKKSQSDDNFLIAGVKDQIESFLEVLNDFKRLVANEPMWDTPEEETIFMQIEQFVRRITPTSYSFLPDDIKELLLSLPLLVEKEKHIRAKLRMIHPPLALSNFPETCKVGFIDFLSNNIKELLKYDHVSIAPVKHRLKQVQPHLETLKCFLKKVSDSEVEKGGLNDIGNRINETAHKLEYVVESIEVDTYSNYNVWLHDLLDEIAAISQQVSNNPETSYSIEFEKHPSVSCETISKDTTSAINDMMVDLVDEEATIINQLMRGSSERDVVSIVGMPGIGKTTLARKVYNNQNILYHFPRRAWCTVSQVYTKRELLLDILSEVQGITDEIQQMTDDDLQSRLRRSLLGNRYLIILDDVWDIAAWKYLEISFPNDSNGSRILITSRLRYVHLEIKPRSDPHFIRLLSTEESWMLLKKNIFKGEGCPEDLLLLGKQIAEHCRGLPLAVVAISGLLQKSKQKRDWWEKMSESLSSEVINDPNPEIRCREILELSYKHLPEHLKPCFLYLGVFLEDRDIPVSKLTKFWMAEGFIQETESENLEDVAEDYLMELINRSLVIISKKRSNGDVKACGLHDLLRDLCHAKAKEENFFHLATMSDEPYASFSASEYDLECHNEHKLDPIAFEDYRLSIYLRRDHFIDSKPSGSRTRSLIFFASADKEPRCPYEISFIFYNFKLLRVLDVESINMGVSFPDEIGLLVHLRYLAVSGYVRCIPPSIAKLWKLQTLIVKGFRGTLILPNTIWSMASLRHLHVNEHVSFNLQGDNDQDEGSFHLDNLVSFSCPSLSCVDYANKILKRLPNLLKMGCIFLKSWDSSKSCNRFPVLEFLTRLESLKIVFYGGAFNAGEYLLPLSLKKLTLSNFRLSWSHISKIGGLPNLVVLKLLSGAFGGPKWEMNEEEFQTLEFLKLDNVNITEWSASYDHLPSLKRLVLQNCKDLQEIPLDFSYINTLEMVEVQWCGKSLEDSAERIGKETMEIKVVITSN